MKDSMKKAPQIALGLHSLLVFSCFLFLTSCNHLFYQPSEREFLTPAKINQAYQELTIETSDGVELSAWLLPTTEKKFGTLVQFHGNAQNMTTHFLYVHWLVNFGFDVVVFDYRGYGLSGGFPSRKGLVDDGRAVIDYLATEQDSGQNGFFVLGQSLGGAVAVPSIALSGAERMGKIRGVLLDSTFTSYRDIAQDKLADIWLTWPLQVPLSYLISDELSLQDYVHQLSMPVIVIHALEDTVVPYHFGEKIFQRIPSAQKQFWKVKRGHVSALASPRSPFRPMLVQFLCRYSRQPKLCLENKRRVEEEAEEYAYRQILPL